MNKLLATLIASSALLVTAMPASSAVTASNSFDVSVTLSSQCKATNSGSTTVDFGTYTAFQPAAATGTPVNLTFDCTRGFSPASVAFDTANGTAAGVGVLQGLQYTLTDGAATTVAGTAASTATIGTADVKTYNITGTMPANQAGTCAAGSCGPTSHTRTLIVTF
ncbi:MAG: spore coat protein U domain-containing protein [Methylophilaceae bacterium]